MGDPNPSFCLCAFLGGPNKAESCEQITRALGVGLGV